jgi:hypothetical protein
MKQAIIDRLTRRIYGRPTIENAARGFYVEEMIALALEPEWTLCSGDYAGWDFTDRRGIRIQVKQSAARQSWKQAKPFGGAFSIAPTKGYWLEGSTYVESPGRQAHIYVFAWHPVYDETVDHCDPDQWVFYVVASGDLPIGQKSIAHSVLAARHGAVPLSRLQSEVRRSASKLAAERITDP